MRYSMFTNNLFRGISIICSSGKELVFRARLSLGQSYPSGLTRQSRLLIRSSRGTWQTEPIRQLASKLSLRLEEILKLIDINELKKKKSDCEQRCVGIRSRYVSADHV
jgi:hypothetical protein